VKKNLACGENIPLLPKYENPNFSEREKSSDK
jgi:hypothetical protein